MLSGGFDPERLAPPGRTEPVIGKIVGHALESPYERSSLRPDDSTLSQTFRDLVARFDELSSENANLKELNADLQAEIDEARAKVAELSEVSQSALVMAAHKLEQAEKVIEFRRGGIQTEIDDRFDRAERRATEADVVTILEEARELSSRRALEVDLETLSILREARQFLLAAAGKLLQPAQETDDPLVTQVEGRAS